MSSTITKHTTPVVGHRLTWGSVGIGVVGVIVGAIGGLILGANIGGNWMTGVSLGSLHGYELTSMIGTVLGGVALGAATLWLAIRHHASR
jgi:hypothetical protein